MTEQSERRTGYRRAEDVIAHQCIQQLPINNISNSIANIDKCLEKIIKMQMEERELLYGKDLNGGLITKVGINSQSIYRAWWFIGLVVFVIFGTGIKVWFF